VLKALWILRWKMLLRMQYIHRRDHGAYCDRGANPPAVLLKDDACCRATRTLQRSSSAERQCQHLPLQQAGKSCIVSPIIFLKSPSLLLRPDLIQTNSVLLPFIFLNQTLLTLTCVWAVKPIPVWFMMTSRAPGGGEHTSLLISTACLEVCPLLVDGTRFPSEVSLLFTGVMAWQVC